MKLNELIAESEKDAVIDRTCLDSESLRTPELVNKYLKELMHDKLAYRTLKIEYDEVELERWKYYTGKAEPEVYKKEPFDFKVLRGDIDKFLNADKYIVEKKKKLAILEEKIRFLEETIKTMNNRNFTIKNAVDWMRFTMGG